MKKAAASLCIQPHLCGRVAETAKVLYSCCDIGIFFLFKNLINILLIILLSRRAQGRGIFVIDKF